MLQPQKVEQLVEYVRRIPQRFVVFGTVFTLLFLYSVVFLVPKSVVFSYGGETCVGQPSLFPGMLEASGKSVYHAYFKDVTKLGSIMLFAAKTCFKPIATPKEGISAVTLAPGGGVIASKTFLVRVPVLPKANTTIFTKPVPATLPLIVPMSTKDVVHTYELKAGDKTVNCIPVKESSISCDLKELTLGQDKAYKATLSRGFAGKATAITETTIKTLPATRIAATSVQEGGIVYDKPKSIAIQFDKPVRSAGAVLEILQGDKYTPAKTELKFSGVTGTIALSEDLSRESTYRVRLDNLRAEDGSTLEQPFVLNFRVSGGPKVTNISVGTRDAGPDIVVTFDQAIDPEAVKQIQLAGGSAAMTLRTDNTINIHLQNFPKCQTFSVQVPKDIKSKYGIASTVAWTFNSRTLCYALSTIGYSRQGRPIQVYDFGNGGIATLFIGALHGNEVSSSLLLKDWINELDYHPEKIPASARVVVITTVNPDGVAANTRNNSNNVNLNRNFPTDTWVSDINDTNGFVKGGGGSEPLSEPESKALASFSQALRPRLLLSYHAVGGVVVGDPGGYSAGYAAKYASMVGYRNGTGQSAQVFDYSITGSYEDWTTQKVGIPSIVIELGSYTYRDFNNHRDAFWAMLQ